MFQIENISEGKDDGAENFYLRYTNRTSEVILKLHIYTTNSP